MEKKLTQGATTGWNSSEKNAQLHDLFLPGCPLLFDRVLHLWAVKNTADTYIISEQKVNTGRSSSQPHHVVGRAGCAEVDADRYVNQNKARKSP